MMRRTDREVTQVEEKIAILKKTSICRLAMCEGGIPYIVPMNYGFDVKGEQLTLYFHCAKQGKKLDLLKVNPLVAFEMDAEHQLITGEVACDYSFAYASIVGRGKVEWIEEIEEKYKALAILMQTFTGQEVCKFNPQLVNVVTVFKVIVSEWTGKRRK